MQRVAAVERVVVHLREELRRGALPDPMPGVHALRRALGANHNTVEKALQMLEQEGLLLSQGPGRPRRLAAMAESSARPMRLAILEFDPPPVAMADGDVVDLVHSLSESGHGVFFAEKCLTDLGMDVERVARMVRKTEADAWIVASASSEVLEWFTTQTFPVMAWFGRWHGLPIASVGPDKVSAMAAMARRLIELGHRRIVHLARRQRRQPVPGPAERAILDEIAAHGIPTSPFNLPDWEETSAGFQKCLKELFRLTPPTALVVGESQFCVPILQFLAKQGLRVPEDVSLVSSDPHPFFLWCEPRIAHIRWDSRPVINRMVRWANNVSRGKKDLRQTLTPAEFVEAGTIGLAKER